VQGRIKINPNCVVFSLSGKCKTLILKERKEKEKEKEIVRFLEKVTMHPFLFYTCHQRGMESHVQDVLNLQKINKIALIFANYFN
jgi:hypothetical protein